MGVYFEFTLYITHRTIRAIKMNLANEGLEARKKEEEVAAKKRKAEDDKLWEGMLQWNISPLVYTPLTIFNRDKRGTRRKLAQLCKQQEKEDKNQI